MNIDEIKVRHVADEAKWLDFLNSWGGEVASDSEYICHQDRAWLLNKVAELEADRDHQLRARKDLESVIRKRNRRITELEAQVNRTCRCDAYAVVMRASVPINYCPYCGGKVEGA